MGIYVDFGGGHTPVPGYINVDLVDTADKIVNLDQRGLMLPFMENQVDGAVSYQLMEHITNLVPLMNEIYRVLKPGAIIEMSMPYANTTESLQDPTHKRQFVEQSWQYFAIGSPFEKEQIEYGIKARFEILKCERGSGVDDWQLFVHLRKPGQLG